ARLWKRLKYALTPSGLKKWTIWIFSTFLQLNERQGKSIVARQGEVFDAIVVGSGISGGWAAKELCEQGLKVLLLERGKMVEHPNYPGATSDPWEFPHRGRLTPEEQKRYHVQTRHFSIHEENKHFYINDLENPYLESA